MPAVKLLPIFALLFLSLFFTSCRRVPSTRPSFEAAQVESGRTRPSFEAAEESSARVRPSREARTQNQIQAQNEAQQQTTQAPDTVIATLRTNQRRATHQPRQRAEATTAARQVLQISELEGGYVDPKVRILLHRDERSRRFNIKGNATISSADGNRITIARGHIDVDFVNENTIRITSHGRRHNVSLPCTLLFVDAGLKFNDGVNDYRGGIIFTGRAQGFSVINFLPIEEYLRGVLPPEIGCRSEREFEALKAQAITARTFAVSRMVANRNRDWDMVPTVMDQVYTGSASECEWPDRAIAATRGLVVVRADNGALLETFFHAICGGRTAAVHYVWNTNPNPSLVSRSDLDENGVAFCAGVNWFTWTETWTISQFSDILRRFSRSTSGEMPFDGTARSVNVRNRTNCGRVNTVEITSNRGTFTYGRDRSRFVMRRPNAAEGLLRSANFDLRIDGNNVIATGRGFGHGIGMCQNGALERARRGQSFTQILAAYYTNIRLGRISEFLR